MKLAELLVPLTSFVSRYKNKVMCHKGREVKFCFCFLLHCDPVIHHMCSGHVCLMVDLTLLGC